MAGAARRGGILRGALFWRWDIQVYLGVGPGEYGVRPDHSTFDIIRNFATRMRAAVVATPPRKECELGCWVPAKRHHFETCAPSRPLPSHPPPPPRPRSRLRLCPLPQPSPRPCTNPSRRHPGQQLVCYQHVCLLCEGQLCEKRLECDHQAATTGTVGQAAAFAPSWRRLHAAACGIMMMQRGRMKPYSHMLTRRLSWHTEAAACGTITWENCQEDCRRTVPSVGGRDGAGRGGGEHQVCQAGTGIRHVPGLSGRARCARRCEENMTVCASYWADGPPRNGSLESLTPVWPSKEACCQAGAGAYVNGDRLASLLP